MIFLGTGAADMIPNPFCDCEICMHARLNQGLFVKKRSCFMVDETTVIDFGPDIAASCIQYNIDFCNLEHILITHTHGDHLSFINLALLSMSRMSSPKPIHIYMSEQGFSWCLQNYKVLLPGVVLIPSGDNNVKIVLGNERVYEIHKITHNKAFTMGNYKVLPLQTNHKSYGENELALNYLLTDKQEQTLLYASDTGVYSEEVLQLISGIHLDYLIMECTFGSQKMEEGCGHLDAYHFVEMIDKLSLNMIIDEKTKIFSTHLNHKHSFNHDDLQEYFNKNSDYEVTVAWDGLRI